MILRVGHLDRVGSASTGVEVDEGDEIIHALAFKYKTKLIMQMNE